MNAKSKFFVSSHKDENPDVIDYAILDLLRGPDGLIRSSDGKVFNELHHQIVSSEESFLSDFTHAARIRPGLDFVGGILLMAVARAEFDRKAGLKRFVPWIITSQRELFQLNPQELLRRGWYTEIPTKEVMVKPRYLAETLLGYLEKGRKGSLVETFDLVRSALKDCVQLRDEEAYSFLTLWIMGTYTLPVFDAYPFIHVNGPKAVGKSTAMEFLAETCFNATLASSSSASAQFRLIHACSPTLLLDESEQFLRKTGGELRSILLSGYRKEGAGVFRTVATKNGWTPQEFNVYGGRAFASQNRFEDVLASRSVKIPMTRAKNPLGKLDRKAAQAIRDSCFLMAMSCAASVHNVYEQLASPDGIVPFSNRDFELFRPILALATATEEPQIVEDITKYAIDSYNDKMADFEESSAEHSMLEWLLGAVSEDREYRGDELLAGFQDHVAKVDPSLAKALTPKSQGELLMALGLVNRKAKKRSSDRKTRLYYLKKSSIIECASAYGIVPEV